MREGEEIELTKVHYETYKKYVKHYLTVMGLVGWDYSFVFEESKISLASVAYGCEGRIARFYLSNVWSTPPCDSMLERVAFHEVHELLLAELVRAATRRTFNEDDFEKEIHSVIRTMENLIFGERELNCEEAEYEWLEENCRDGVDEELDEVEKLEMEGKEIDIVMEGGEVEVLKEKPVAKKAKKAKKRASKGKSTKEK
jgi:hypothetical protein